MAFNKIDGVTSFSKQLNRWRNVVVLMCQQSRNSHVAQRPAAVEQVVSGEAVTKMTDHLAWSKNSPVSLLVDTARKPQHNRTLELKKAAAQLSRSNESLKAHYIQKRIDRSAEELLAKEPQTAKKLASLMSLNIAMVETKRPRSSSAPARGMETSHPTGAIDFKPQTQRIPRWQPKKATMEASAFNGGSLKVEKDHQKGDLNSAPVLAEPTKMAELPQQKSPEVEGKLGKAASVDALKTASLINLASENQILRKPTEVAKEPIAKNLNSLTKWKIGSRSIPRLDI